MNGADWNIRGAVPTDAAAVSAVLADSYPVLMASAYDPAVLAAVLPAMVSANPALLASGTYYLAEVAEAVVACGGWTLDEPGSGRREPGVAHVRHFATRIGWSGRGLGRALFDRCLRDALAAGVHRFECAASLNAEPFYRALGFATLRRVDVRLRNGEPFPTLAMARALCASPA